MSAEDFVSGTALWRGPLGAGQIVVDQLGWGQSSRTPVQVGLAAALANGLGIGSSVDTGPIELPTTGWSAFTQPAGSDPHFAFDRDTNTRWTSNTSQRPGMYYGLDLGAVHAVTRIIWDTSPSPGDYPQGVQVQVSIDNQNWTTVFSAGDASPYVLGGVLTLDFAPVNARYLKVVDTGSTGLYLSVHEIYVFAMSS